MDYILQENEFFYGGAINDGIYAPYNINSDYSLDLNVFHSANQAASLLYSNKGNIFYSNYPFKITFKNNKLTLEGKEIKHIFLNATLKKTYQYICENIFLKCNIVPDDSMFIHPQFNTWIEMEWNCTQKKILTYAKKIIANGYKPGVLMIDDCWCQDYGVWDFDRRKFPNPKHMIDELHSLGFEVVLWVCPFISLDSHIYRSLENTNCLVKNKDNQTFISHWWDGYSAVLNLEEKEAVEWIKDKLDYLTNKYGVDGFKFDACDPEYYVGSNLTNYSLQATKWCEIGESYKINELRVAFNNGISGCAHRLKDKNHSWDNDGLNMLIPNGIALGMIGNPYLCPDMIGGGMVPDFHRNGFSFDEELFIRYAQISSMFPMMQFSLAPWKCLSKENQKICLQAVKTHEKYSDLIIKLAKNAKTGMPIIRSMAFNLDDEKYSFVNDQFFLGDDILVCPQTKKSNNRKIILPKGQWQDENGIIYNEGEYVIDTPLSRIPIFTKIN